MLSIQNISYKIDSKTILNDVSMEVPKGKLSVLVGKNGAGKSTLLKAMCDNITPTNGAIFIDDSPLSSMDTKEIAQKRAVVQQKSHVPFSFTVFEIVLMGRAPHTNGFEGERDYQIAEACMDKLQVRHLQHRKFPTLSGGEQQRVQLAQAMTQIWDCMEEKDPCYLLLDEPTSSLDIAHQHQLLSLLREIAGEGVTVFSILHDLNLAAQYGDLIHVMKKGTCVASGQVREIFQPGIIEDAFECPVKIMNNPHFDCPLIVGGGQVPSEPDTFQVR